MVKTECLSVLWQALLAWYAGRAEAFNYRVAWHGFAATHKIMKLCTDGQYVG